MKENHMKKIFPVVLAAGQGKRMQSDLPKVLHEVGGRSMVYFPLRLAAGLTREKINLVVAKDHAVLAAHLDSQNQINKTRINKVVQTRQRGTGDALACALAKIPAKSGTILLMNGDMPLISENSVRELLKNLEQAGAPLAILTVKVNAPLSYGRVVRDGRGMIRAIVEERDCTDEQRRIQELNCGVYAIDLEFARTAVKKITPENAQGEYYVTDLVKIAVNEGMSVASASVGDAVEALGINSQRELWAVNRQYYLRRREELWGIGVRSQGADIIIDADVQIGAGSLIQSPCYLYGKTRIGSGVVIEPGNVLRDCTVEDGAVIKSFCYMEGAHIGKNCRVGPFAHLREGSELAEDAKVGNFVETKKTKIGKGSKINHLSYVGDATVGSKVNIGAGTITCNYDGVQKFKTVIEDGVFIGSDTQLVAPLRIGKGAMVGAGTTVTKSVKPESLVLSRVKQVEVPGWAKKRRIKSPPAKQSPTKKS